MLIPDTLNAKTTTTATRTGHLTLAPTGSNPARNTHEPANAQKHQKTPKNTRKSRITNNA
jgi:hypothetical protein